MPGLYGAISNEISSTTPVINAMLKILSYGRAVHSEDYRDDQIQMGCVHLRTGGQHVLYNSPQACVAFFGYLTQPTISPAVSADGANWAARCIHDRYIECGEKVFLDLEGAYAVVIWDKRNRTLLLGEDRMGLRPIYYAEHHHTFLFASEVKAFLVNPTFPRQLDRVAAACFFHFRYLKGERTFFEDIHLLPPASFIRWRDNKWDIVRYWTPVYPDSFPSHPDSWYDEQIEATLKAAIKRADCKDLRYGISLSSGMDSRWIAALMSDLQPGTHSFTFQGAFTSPAEVEIARRVADLTGLEHHHMDLSPNFIADFAHNITFISDGMQSLVDSQEFPLTLEMSKHVDVAVGGFMGSGFFGHNPIFYFIPAHEVFQFQKQRMRAVLPPRAVLDRFFGKQTYADLENSAFLELQAANKEAPCKLGFQILSYEEINQRQRRFTFSAQLLKTPFVDMVHPIADRQVWDLSLQLPPSQLMYKRAFRRALARYYPQLAALPWNKIPGTATASVPSIFTRQVYNRVSQSIKTKLSLTKHNRARFQYQDYSDWLRGPLRSFIEPILLSEEANASGLFDTDGLYGVVKDHFEGRLDITPFLGIVLPFILWTKMFYLPSIPRQPDLLTTLFLSSQTAGG